MLRTRVVAPLIRVAELPIPIRELNPPVEIDGEDYRFVAQSLAALTLEELGRRLGNLDRHHDPFTRALDILPTGF